MLKQTISYTDFNGTARTEDLYFNLTEIELVDIQIDSKEGIQKDLEAAIADKDLRKLLDFIKMLVHKGYGLKSEDGRNHDKSPTILNDFVSSALYSDLLLNLFADEGARAEKFITGLMPKDLIERAMALSQEQGNPAANYKPDAREVNARHMTDQKIPAATEEAKFEESAPMGAPAVPFRVKETPIEPGQTNEEKMAAFEAWQANQNHNTPES